MVVVNLRDTLGKWPARIFGGQFPVVTLLSLLSSHLHVCYICIRMFSTRTKNRHLSSKYFVIKSVFFSISLCKECIVFNQKKSGIINITIIRMNKAVKLWGWLWL
jgi:hypothetical protein